MSGSSNGWVRDILLKLWDPIGGVPEGEYDTYIPGILRMMDTSDSRGLANHLLEIERSAMCLPVPSRERAQRTAEALFAARQFDER